MRTGLGWREGFDPSVAVGSGVLRPSIPAGRQPSRLRARLQPCCLPARRSRPRAASPLCSGHPRSKQLAWLFKTAFSAVRSLVDPPAPICIYDRSLRGFKVPSALEESAQCGANQRHAFGERPPAALDYLGNVLLLAFKLLLAGAGTAAAWRWYACTNPAQTLRAFRLPR